MSLGSTWHYLLSGGPMMFPILLASILCLTFIVERFFALRKSVVLPSSILAAIENAKGPEGIAAIYTLSQAQKSPLSNVLLSSIDAKELSEEDFKEVVERSGKREAMNLEKNLVYLGILSALGPLLGLFGTVTGMIAIFSAVRQVGVGSPQELSGGISEALLCTAGGMSVAIPALIFHRYFMHKVDGLILSLEEAISKVSKILRSKK